MIGAGEERRVALAMIRVFGEPYFCPGGIGRLVDTLARQG